MDLPNLIRFDEIETLLNAGKIIDYQVYPEYQDLISPYYENEVILTLLLVDGTFYNSHVIFNPITRQIQPLPSYVTNLLTQPEILERLCLKLSLKDLNEFRKANNLDRLECQIPVNDRHRRISFVSYLDDQAYQWINQIEIRGSYPLTLESYPINKEKFKFLIDHGADPDSSDERQNTLLMKTSKRGDLVTVKYLIEHGAEIDLMTMYGNTALSRAAENGHLDIVKYLVELGADKSSYEVALFWSLIKGQFETFKYLFERNGNIEGLLNMGLVESVKKRNLEMVKYFIHHGADANLPDPTGEKALDVAIQLGYQEIVDFLEPYVTP